MPVNHGANSAAGKHNSDDVRSDSDSDRDRGSGSDSGRNCLLCKGCGELFATESMLRRHRNSGRAKNTQCRVSGPGVPKQHGSNAPVRHGTGGSGRFHIPAMELESDESDADQDFFQPPSLQVRTD
jgi:hypothetical protein